MLGDLDKAFYIARKDLKEYYMKPGTISWGIIFPLVFALAFMVRRGGLSLWLAPGMISLALFFGSTSMSAMAIVFERKIGSFERLLLFPVNYTCIALGKSLSSFVLGTLSSIPVLLLSWLIVPASTVNPLLMIFTISLASFTSSTFGVLISFLVKDPSQVMTIFNLIRFPMMFLSNIIIPVNTLPPYFKLIALLLPLTYINESIRYSYTGRYDLVPPQISIGVTLVMGLIFLYISSIVIRRERP